MHSVREAGCRGSFWTGLTRFTGLRRNKRNEYADDVCAGWRGNAYGQLVPKWKQFIISLSVNN